MPVQFNHAPSGKVTLKAPASGNLTLTLPGTDGTSGQALVTDGSGNLSFGSGGGGGGGGLTLTANGTISTGDAVAFVSGKAEPISSTPASFAVNIPSSASSYSTIYPGNPYPTSMSPEWYGSLTGPSNYGVFGALQNGNLVFYEAQDPSSGSLPSGPYVSSINNVGVFRFVYNSNANCYLGFYYSMGSWYAGAFTVGSSGSFTWLNDTYIGGNNIGGSDIAVVTSNTGANVVDGLFQGAGTSALYKLSATWNGSSFSSSSSGNYYQNYGLSSMFYTTSFTGFAGYSQEYIASYQQGAAVLLNPNSGQPQVFTYYGGWQNYNDFLITVSCDYISPILQIKSKYLGFFTCSPSSGIYWVSMDIQNPSTTWAAQYLGSWPGGFSWYPTCLIPVGASSYSASDNTSITCLVCTESTSHLVVVELTVDSVGVPVGGATISSTDWFSYTGFSADIVVSGRPPQGLNGVSNSALGTPAPATLSFVSASGYYYTGYNRLATSTPASSNTSQMVGVATAGASSGSAVTVGTLYNTVTPGSGSPFTVGSDVYVDSTGTFNQSASGTLIGVATSSTQLVVTNVPGFTA